MAENVLDEIFHLRDKVIVITSGGGFITGTLARGIARCGAKVAVLDISQAAAEKVTAEIRQMGYSALALQPDDSGGGAAKPFRECIGIPGSGNLAVERFVQFCGRNDGHH